MMVVTLILLTLLGSPGSTERTRFQERVFEVKDQAASAFCKQTAVEREELLDEAEAKGFSLRRLEVIGNISTRDEVIYRRIAVHMAVGEKFSRAKLRASLKNLSRLKTIYPVTMKNVIAHIDGVEKTVDLQICIKERSQTTVRAS